MPRGDERLAWAEAKLKQCRRISLRYFGRRLRIERKADRSPVTIADRTVEEFLRRELARAFPNDAIVGEEFGGSTAVGDSYWTIDPIDGTRPFSRGLPSWGTLLARIERGRPVMGASDFPAIETFIGSARGAAAYERTRTRRALLKRARAVPLDEAVIFHGGSAWWLPTRYGPGFTRVVSRCYLERAYGDCYAYLWLFRGCADAMLDYGVKVWDIAPFAAIADATGHASTDCAGRSCFTGPESIVAHPRLVGEIAKLLRPGARSHA